jgi:hypothetical protein
VPSVTSNTRRNGGNVSSRRRSMTSPSDMRLSLCGGTVTQRLILLVDQNYNGMVSQQFDFVVLIVRCDDEVVSDHCFASSGTIQADFTTPTR